MLVANCPWEEFTTELVKKKISDIIDWSQRYSHRSSTPIDGTFGKTNNKHPLEHEVAPKYFLLFS